MTRSTTHRLARWVGALTASVLIIACSDAPTSPPASAANLGGCTNLQTTPGSTVAAHLYATGVQIYRWNDTAWVFVSPSASVAARMGRSEKVSRFRVVSPVVLKPMMPT